MSGITPLPCYKDLGEKAARRYGSGIHAMEFIRDSLIEKGYKRDSEIFKVTLEHAQAIYAENVAEELERSRDAEARGCTKTGAPMGYRGNSSEQKPVRSQGDRGIRRHRSATPDDGPERCEIVEVGGGRAYRKGMGELSG